MSTLAERIQWILANTKAPDGTRWSGYSLSEKAGLSKGHIGLMRRGDVGEGVTAEVLAKVAKAAGVSLKWLTTGEGEPVAGETRVEYDERYPNRAQAVELLAGVVEPEAVEAIKQWRLHSSEDRTVEWWAARIKEIHAEIREEQRDPKAAKRREAQDRADTAALAKGVAEKMAAGRRAGEAKAREALERAKGEEPAGEKKGERKR